MQCKINFVSIQTPSILSKYFGQTEAAIRGLFQKARISSPCILFFDEFDIMAYDRGAAGDSSSSDGGVGSRVLSTFLNELDGVTSTTKMKEGLESKFF